MIYISVGNWISIIGFSICIVYCLVLLVFAIIKRFKAKKAIKKEQEKKAKKNESQSVTK